MAAIISEASRPSGAEPFRLRWGAIFGGAFVALALWALLYVFGLAVGLSSINGQDGQFSFPGLFTGIWAIVAPLLALFVGGIVAGRTAGAQDRGSGTIHGLVLWGFTTLLSGFLLFSLVSTLLSGVVGLGRGAAQVAGQAPQAASALNLSPNQLMQPVNQKLAEQGLPPLTPQQLEATGKDIAQRSLQQGSVNRQVIENALIANTQLDRQSIQQLAGELEGELQQAQGQLQTTAANVAETSGKAMWGLFFALVLGLVSAVLGAGVGTSRKQTRLANAQTRGVIRPEDLPPERTHEVTPVSRRGEVIP